VKDAPEDGTPPPSLPTQAPCPMRRQPSSQAAQAAFVEPPAPLGASSGAASQLFADLDMKEGVMPR
jgi:hypothetical protein